MRQNYGGVKQTGEVDQPRCLFQAQPKTPLLPRPNKVDLAF